MSFGGRSTKGMATTIRLCRSVSVVFPGTMFDACVRYANIVFDRGIRFVGNFRRELVTRWLGTRVDACNEAVRVVVYPFIVSMYRVSAWLSYVSGERVFYGDRVVPLPVAISKYAADRASAVVLFEDPIVNAKVIHSWRGLEDPFLPPTFFPGTRPTQRLAVLVTVFTPS